MPDGCYGKYGLLLEAPVQHCGIFRLNCHGGKCPPYEGFPGRKTDVKDSERIADLVQHGLLQASYIPDREQRELRELVSYRKSLVQDRTRELNRLQKMLEGANTKLSGTIADINGKSARGIIDTILSGTAIDSLKYDEMYDKKVIAHNLKGTDH